MRLKEAIQRADALRPNTIDEKQKAAWLYELEGQIAEYRYAPPPTKTWPQDMALAIPPPDDTIYERYLCAMIDYANEETGLYADDMALFNQKYAETIARIRRHRRPPPSGGFVIGF